MAIYFDALVQTTKHFFEVNVFLLPFVGLDIDTLVTVFDIDSSKLNEINTFVFEINTPTISTINKRSKSLVRIE